MLPRHLFACTGIFLFSLHFATPARSDEEVPPRCYEYCCEAAASVAARIGPAQGHGTYALEYQGGPHGKSLIHTKATFQAWITETQERIDLNYDTNHDGFPRSIIVRAGNLHFSHRFAPSGGGTPMALVTGIYSPDTRPVLHGMIIDPAVPHLTMLDVRNYTADRIRFLRLADGLIEGRIHSDKDAKRLSAAVVVDPARGYLPVRQRSFRGGNPEVVEQEATLDWQRIQGRWFCRRYEVVHHREAVIDGMTYQRRVCRLEFKELKPVETLDAKLFHLDSLELPPGTMVGDLRKDAAEHYFPYKPEHDPRQLELDRIVESARALALTPPKVGKGVAPWQIGMTGVGAIVLGIAFYLLHRQSRFTSRTRAALPRAS